jgi:hypothetical protein
MAGVAGIPMRLDDQIIGALNLYSPSRATGRVRTSRSPGYWPTRRPATWSTPPSRASRSSPASSCNRRWNLGSSSSRPRGSPPSSTPSQLIRPTSSCAGTPETTTPVCGDSPKQSLPWDSRSEPMRPSVCSCGAALNLGGPCPISSGTIDSIRPVQPPVRVHDLFHISPQLFHRLQPPCVVRPGERVFSPHEAPGWKALGGPGRPGLLHRAGFALPGRRAPPRTPPGRREAPDSEIRSAGQHAAGWRKAQGRPCSWLGPFRSLADPLRSDQRPFAGPTLRIELAHEYSRWFQERARSRILFVLHLRDGAAP